MRFGVTIAERGLQARPDEATAIVRHAESLSFYAVEMGDHIVIPADISSKYPYTTDGSVPDWEEWNEQLTTLAFLAGRTTSVRLIASVLVLPYRNPLLAAKMLATLDFLSKGRLVVGVGAGWMREEFEALGAPPFEERGSVVEEYIRFFRSVWSEESPTFHGRYFSLTSRVKFNPKPAQKPYPPIWVGGESPRAMRRAAALGDAWYPIGSNPHYPLRTLDQLRSATQRLRGYAAEAGREPQEIGLSFVAPQLEIRDGGEESSGDLFVGDAVKVVADVRAVEQLGFSYLSFDFIKRSLDETLEGMNLFAEKVLRHLA